MTPLTKFIAFFFIFILQANCIAQIEKKRKPIKTPRDIPHATTFEKLIRPHRIVTFFVTKERKINYDTTYIKSNYKKLVVTLPLSTKFLQFSLVDQTYDRKLVYTPSPQYNIGFSLSSRWISFILNSGIKIYGGEQEKQGRTKFHDYQLNLYGRRVTTDMFVQNYTGFYIKNSTSFENYESEKPYEIRPDVNAIHLGVSSYYNLNHRKLSYGSAFAFVEQQKKSAGSLLLGTYYSYLNVSADSSLISAPFRNDFDTLSLVRSGQTSDFGLNIGYVYTLVFLKKFQVTASAVQGIGGKHLSFRHDDGSISNELSGGAGKFHLRLAVKYDTGKFFIGTMGILDYFLFSGFSHAAFDYSFGKIMLCSGYRFSVIRQEKRLLRKLQLTDY